MARPLRIQEAGLTYHVRSRGNARTDIFLDDDDRRLFLGLFARIAAAFRLTCHAFCLMANHYHLVFTTADANLSAAMRDLNGEYAQSWNRRHGRVGHAFEGRFRAQVVQDGVYFLTVCRYVVLNPVRARMVRDPGEWAWSSYRATCRLCPAHGCLSTDLLLAQFGDDVTAYREFVAAARLLERLPKAPVIGDKRFRMRFSPAGDAASPEVPRDERAVGKPPLPEWFRGAVTRAERNAQIAHAYRSGYRMSEIARVLGVHYSTVSRILSGCQVLKNTGIQDLTPQISGRGSTGDRRSG